MEGLKEVMEMKENQIDVALSFLLSDGFAYVVLQVQMMKDIELIQDYIIEKLGVPLLTGSDYMLYYGKHINFQKIDEFTEDEYDKECLFYIERKGEEYGY